MTVMLGLTGCSPTSQIRIPLVDPSMAVDARALAGVYTLKQQDGDIGYLHVDSATKEYPANFLRLTWVSGYRLRALSSPPDEYGAGNLKNERGVLGIGDCVREVARNCDFARSAKDAEIR